jgi:hypothetical protein
MLSSPRNSPRSSPRTLATPTPPAGDSMIHQAVEKNDQEAIRDLIQYRGKDINEVNAGGETPLLLALRQKNEDMAIFLIHCGADPDRCNIQVLRQMTETARLNKLVRCGVPWFVGHRYDTDCMCRSCVRMRFKFVLLTSCPSIWGFSEPTLPFGRLRPERN